MLTGYIKSRNTENAELKKLEDDRLEVRLNQFDSFTGTKIEGKQYVFIYDTNNLLHDREMRIQEVAEIQKRADADIARVQAEIAEIDAVLADAAQIKKV